MSTEALHRPWTAGPGLGSVPSRLLWVAAALGGEELIFGALPRPWFTVHRLAENAIVFLGALLFFGWRRLRAMEGTGGRLNLAALAAHLASLAVAGATNYWLLRATAGSGSERVAESLWFGSLALLPLTALAAALPARTLTRIPAQLGSAWAYAAFCALPMLFKRTVFALLWSTPGSPGMVVARGMRGATLETAAAALRLFYSGVVANRAEFTLSTPKFSALIKAGCAGVEGVALMAVTATAWMIWQRRELRLGRAIVVALLSLCMMWTLNIVRIVALFAIGIAGYPDIAVTGFHSEAGWIAFTTVAMGFAAVCSRWRWLRQAGDEPRSAEGMLATSNRTAVYLVPFLAVVAASLVTQAGSSGFEWLYPLRLVAALAVLWVYRREYSSVNWRFGWMGFAAGAAVFVAWIALSGPGSTGGSEVMAAGLARLTAAQRVGWIAARVAAAAITVPIVEELAFRGFLARRLVAEDFEQVEMRNLSWTAVLVSSAVFGLMHGRMWLAGMLAGAAFALVAKLRNRLGEAVAAHATANLLLAAWVLTRGDYRLW